MSFINTIRSCCPCCFSDPIEPRNQLDIPIQAVTNTTQTPETGPPNAPEGNPPQGSPKQKRPPVVVNQLKDQQHLYPQTNPGSTEPEEEEEEELKMDEARALLPKPPLKDSSPSNIDLGLTFKEFEYAKFKTTQALLDLEIAPGPTDPGADLPPFAKELGFSTLKEWKDAQRADLQAREELDHSHTNRPTSSPSTSPPTSPSPSPVSPTTGAPVPVSPVPSAPPPPQDPRPYFDENGDELCISRIQPFNPNHQNK